MSVVTCVVPPCRDHFRCCYSDTCIRQYRGVSNSAKFGWAIRDFLYHAGYMVLGILMLLFIGGAFSGIALTVLRHFFPDWPPLGWNSWLLIAIFYGGPLILFIYIVDARSNRNSEKTP